jgi:hypothetical protein
MRVDADVPALGGSKLGADLRVFLNKRLIHRNLLSVMRDGCEHRGKNTNSLK